MMMKKYKKTIFYAVVIGISVILFLFVATSSWIGFGVGEQCENAQAKYGGDCVEALSRVVSGESNSLEDRKDAVWALGQLGDGRALVVLEKYYEGSSGECKHETNLCQYELKKAIKLAQGGFNATALIWRNGAFNFSE